MRVLARPFRSNPGLVLRKMLTLLSNDLDFRTAVSWIGVVLWTCGCSTTPPAEEIDRFEVIPAHAIETILIRGGSAAGRNGPDERFDIVLENEEDRLFVVAAGQDTTLTALDTVDISGLYLHSMDPFNALVEARRTRRSSARSSPMYIVRKGASAGTTAMWLISPDEIRRLGPADNRPSGPKNESVGCYSVTRDDWSDPEFNWDRMSVWFPDTVRLHWAYDWRWTSRPPQPHLIATDGSGQIRDPAITVYAWSPSEPDSVRVTFGVWYMLTIFRGAVSDGGFKGELSVLADDNFSVRAPARLERVECPG